MTQNYYVDNVLPVNAEAVKSIRLIDDKIMAFTREWGPSHGIKNYGLAQEHKKAHNI